MNKITIHYLVAIIGGGIGVFAFSPFDYWWVAYLSILALLLVISNPQRKHALLGAYLWGLTFFACGINWVHVSINQFGNASLWLAYLCALLLAGYLALYPLLFAYIIKRLQIKTIILFPIFWTLTEFLRAVIFTGFPWLQFGYSQIDSPIAGVGALFGVQGITFLMFWVCASFLYLIVNLVTKTKYKTMHTLGSVFSLIAVIGLAIYSTQVDFVQADSSTKKNITLIQGNISQSLKWDQAYLTKTLAIYNELIMQNIDKGGILVLPEAAFPLFENDNQDLYQALDQIAVQNNVEIVMGSLYQDPETYSLFNSIIVLGNPEQPYTLLTTNRYNKHHLVPFGENIPFESILRPLAESIGIFMPNNLHQGDRVQKNLALKDSKLLAAICYEIVLGSQIRDNLRKDTSFIVTVSNDAWFGDSIGPWQHLQMARMRALEVGKPIIRATNTGISVIINHKGKIIAQVPQFKQAAITHTVSPVIGNTPYAVLGNLPLMVLIIFGLFVNGFKWAMQRVLERNIKLLAERNKE